MFYGNGDYETYEYNNAGNITAIRENGTKTDSWRYNYDQTVEKEEREKPDIDPEVPPTEEDGYIVPRRGPSKEKGKNGDKGWVDKYGNNWVPVPNSDPDSHGGAHWDV